MHPCALLFANRSSLEILVGSHKALAHASAQHTLGVVPAAFVAAMELWIQTLGFQVGSLEPSS